MLQEYTVSTGNKIMFTILGMVMAVFALFLFSLSTRGNTAVMLIPMVILVGAACLIISQYKRCIIIDDISFTRINMFGTTEVAIADIKGVRIGNRYFKIEYEGGKLGVNNPLDYAGGEELIAYLRKNFTDLDKLDQEAELNEILNDTAFGATKEERQARLDKAKEAGIGYNASVIWIGVMALVSGNGFVMAFVLLYPLLGIWAITAHGGLVRFLPKNNSPRYSVFWGTLLASAIAIIRSLTDFIIIKFSALWLPFTVMVVIFVLVFYWIGRRQKTVYAKTQLVFFVFVGMLYSLGAVREINCVYDGSTEQQFVAQVVDHHISHGKSTSYYITLGPWGPVTTESEQDVTAKKYYDLPVNSNVIVHYKKGLLDMPWFVFGE